jgi:hypothetical protein
MSAYVRVICGDHGAITAGKPLSAGGVRKAGLFRKVFGSRGRTSDPRIA